MSREKTKIRGHFNALNARGVVCGECGVQVPSVEEADDRLWVWCAGSDGTLFLCGDCAANEDLAIKYESLVGEARILDA